MSGHKHDEGCHCSECEGKKDEGRTSMDEAGGVAVGFVGHIHGFNADVEARLDKAMIKTGEYVQEKSGCLLGHIKIAIYHEDGTGITLNLTDLDNGVEHHGTMDPCEKVSFNFMAAVLDVDKHELEHEMDHILEETCIDYCIESGHHHHHDGEECHCHDHEHEHEHHHHHDGEECHCHDHEHEHEHRDDECHCAACEQQRKEDAKAVKKPKKSFFSKLRRKTE